MSGLLKAKTEAKATYDNSVKAGKKSCLLTKLDNSNYQILIGNIEKDETILIQYSYITHIENNKFVLQTNIAPRYKHATSHIISHITDDYDGSEYTTNVMYKFDLSVNWKSSNKITNFENPTNNKDITINKVSDYHYLVTAKTVPQEGSLTLVCGTEKKPCVYFTKKDGKVYVMVNNSIESKDVVTDRVTEYVFVLDRSGSMEQDDKINNAKNALKLFVQSLPSNSYFNVVGFGSDCEFLWEKSVKYNEENMKQAIGVISCFEADLGGTDIYKPLERIFNQGLAGESSEKVILLLTDGDVSNISELSTIVKNNNTKARVFTLGIGRDVNRFLVEKLASSGNGIHKILVDVKNIGEVVISMLEDAGKDWYKNITINLGSEMTIKNNISGLTLYPNNYFTVYAEYVSSDDFDKVTNIVIMGENGVTGEKVEWVLSLDSKKEIQFVNQLYAKNIIETVKNEHMSVQDKKTEVERMTSLSLEHHIVTDHTSFVLVNEEETVTPEEQLVQVTVPHYASQMSYMSMAASSSFGGARAACAAAGVASYSFGGARESYKCEEEEEVGGTGGLFGGDDDWDCDEEACEDDKSDTSMEKCAIQSKSKSKKCALKKSGAKTGSVSDSESEEDASAEITDYINFDGSLKLSKSLNKLIGLTVEKIKEYTETHQVAEDILPYLFAIKHLKGSGTKYSMLLKKVIKWVNSNKKTDIELLYRTHFDNKVAGTSV
jgi:hypothetical protein